MNEKYFFVIAITFASECEIKLQKSLLCKKNKQKSRRFFFFILKKGILHLFNIFSLL